MILFLDYDGTLRDFEDEPLAAIPSEALLQLLQGLPALGSTQGGVAFWAHIGGFVAGVALIHPFKRRDLMTAHQAQPQRRTSKHRWF